MCTNFDYLKQNKLYESFAEQAIEAERSLLVSSATCAILTRRALELAVRWVFAYDDELTIPYQDNISSLIHEKTFQNIIEPALFPMLKYTIKLGNIAVHTNSTIKRDDAVLSLHNLFEFCDWIDYSYSDIYIDKVFDESILENAGEQKRRHGELKDLYEKLSAKDRKLEEVCKENEELRAKMSQARALNVKFRVFHVDEATEAEVRERYINLDLQEAGWTIGKDCLTEVPVVGMPKGSGKGYADYVLYGKNSLPLAVLEAKKPSVKAQAGSQQAKIYADCLERQYGQRPLIFTSNGFEMYYTNDAERYAERRVSGIFTQEEMQLEVDRRKQRIPLRNIEINDRITERPYQKEAVTAVCDAIEHRHRKMLIVQATGSGKTRVSISIVDVLCRHNYVKNILFLADRVALVRQAKRNYSELLQDLTVCDLLDNKDNPEQSRMIFSTYATMMNAIDEKKDKFERKLFTPAHFDLIIIDESHRSIYKKYQAIFDYFDAMLLGMTATPKDEIDKNTYSVFDLERGVPTFAYDLKQAVEEGYLVNYNTLESGTQIMENGIHYNELSEEEKEEFEEKFGDDDEIEEEISSAAVNAWFFNEVTVDLVLKELLEKGLKVEGGDKLGKTIIFAKNSKHAAFIVDRFNKIYPEYGGDFMKQIDNSIKMADTLIESFVQKDDMPQIAVSVDMLDTGIDVPSILNLVFFKKVRSYSKFWQMIGRGTRTCKDLFGPGDDKKKFLIFDFCNNFEYFRVETHGDESKIQPSLCEKLYNTKVLIARELQDGQYQNREDFCQYRMDLVDELHGAVVELQDRSFRVRQHLRQVEKYRDKAEWANLESVAVSDIREHISPLVMPATREDEVLRRFDYLMYSIDLGMLQGKNVSQPIKTVVQTAENLSKKCNQISQIKAQKHVIDMVQSEEFWMNADVIAIEKVRTVLRELLQYLDKIDHKVYYANFTDQILETKEGQPVYVENEFKNYRKKVEFYLKEHQDNLAVYKLRNNKKLSESDLRELERILWQELGSRTEYESEYGDTPIGKLVRQIVGVERSAVNEAFSRFISEGNLDVNQIRFVNLIVDYIVANGNIDDRRVFQQEPFRSVGSIMTVFQDKMTIARKIMDVIEEINRNSTDIA